MKRPLFCSRQEGNIVLLSLAPWPTCRVPSSPKGVVGPGIDISPAINFNLASQAILRTVYLPSFSMIETGSELFWIQYWFTP